MFFPHGHHILEESVYQNICSHYVYYLIASFIIIRGPYNGPIEAAMGVTCQQDHMRFVSSTKA